ncbi:protein transport protein YIF1 [Pyrenophora tritici-repentis]|uniref:Protein YIF1 n=2 Tax=Pyrenophora tritici-repentis TaxID=45151 RepID=A0A2W1H7Y2_9PLEO|nr:protein transport protein YIF1 [Pyrenophora tritici-repentis Pt-1C-BFP]KAA8619390.1 Protein transport protein YIF1 [Pyrenophora tritici-repentis]EDU46158.1 protein transport protein YIF1 [Pyrenophora tritici-repentis Pt-1C-BFP]KAF7449838.1 Protein transport protein [Pyrenophora tritici-repentis]KAG9383231.1 Protein transport protein YIF1 [Pyrenophora tritici-repentis]KAI0572617.1 Protein transport protein YIF1 [Pyrenophora tritici-repentis]
MQRPNYTNPPPAHSPPLHHPVPQHVSTVPQLRSPPPPQPPSQPQSGYGYGQQGGGMPQQGGGYNMHPSFGGFINDPTAQLGFQMGKSAVDAGQQYVEQNLGRLVSVSALKHYFNVTNSYVLTKLRIILIPWWHRPWSRQHRHTPDPTIPSSALLYQPPREDVNSPDMYIPTMALVTYILLSTLLAGLRGAFHPELLGYTATVAISVTLLEILIIRTGTFLLAISSSSQLLDLVAYSGYKFVHVIVSLLLSHLATWIGFGSAWVSWVIFLYCFGANAFFLLRSLRYVLLPDQSGQGNIGGNVAPGYGGKSQKNRRTQFLFVYSYVVQFGFMVWLSKV